MSARENEPGPSARTAARRAAARLAAPLRAAVAPYATTARAELLVELRTRATALLAPRAALLDAARADADALAAALRLAEPRAAAAVARLDRSPFSPAMTVHAAHARHPGVQAVFARHGLPRCPDCAVGADETLAEAAFGEALALDALLAELDALLPPPEARRA